MEPFAVTSTFDVEAAGCGSSPRLATHCRVALCHSAVASDEGGLTNRTLIYLSTFNLAYQSRLQIISIAAIAKIDSARRVKPNPEWDMK